jgi:hypothetical protein
MVQLSVAAMGVFFLPMLRSCMLKVSGSTLDAAMEAVFDGTLKHVVGIIVVFVAVEDGSVGGGGGGERRGGRVTNTGSATCSCRYLQNPTTDFITVHRQRRKQWWVGN